MLRFLLLLLGVFGLATTSHAQRVSPDDSLALVAFYQATDGPNWVDNTHWLTRPVSLWIGVTVENERVTSLDLAGQVNEPYGLKGELPADLGDLAHLQDLDLSFNELTGSIPAELGGIDSLKYLNLGSNELTGVIPEEVGNLAQLKRLDLSVNDLTGTVPASLGKLGNLESMGLYLNRLSGEIPPSLGNMDSLTFLNLQINQLTGSIPAELGNLAALTSLTLSVNKLTGSIPDELGALEDLRFLSLQLNELTGPLPPELGALSQLHSLILDYNQLNGELPPELGNLTNLTDLQLDSNDFDGPMPLSLINLAQLTRFEYASTTLCAPSDAGFQAWINGIDNVKSNGLICAATATENEHPAVFALQANYPNPFTSVTRLRYALPEASVVRLSIYDVQGRLIEVLVDRPQQAGWHEALFQAGALPSGVYFYRLQAGGYRDTGQMLLVK